MKGYTQLQHVKVMTKMDIKRSGDNSKQKQHDSDRENGSKLYFLQRDKISKITLLFLFYLREVNPNQHNQFPLLSPALQPSPALV